MARAKADRKADSQKPKTKRKTTGAKAKAKTKAENRDDKGRFEQGNSGGPGRDTVYTDELGERISELLADGLTVNEIERMDGMPAGRTIRRWALNREHPFSPLYEEGRKIGYHKMADDLIEAASDGRNDWMAREMAKQADDEPTKVAWQINGEHVSRSRLRADTMKWTLAKALPKIYGDKLALTDPDGGALTVRFTR